MTRRLTQCERTGVTRLGRRGTPVLLFDRLFKTHRSSVTH
jgi:hypothetical protein